MNEKLNNEQINYFENKFRTEQEPWNYSHKAVELLRYEFILNLIRTLKPDCNNILEVGCALGEFTKKLNGAAKNIFSFDISPTAVKKTRARCSFLSNSKQEIISNKSRYFFCTTSATEFPFQQNVFEVVLLCDGIIGWEISKEQRAEVLVQAFQSITYNGFVILTYYLHPKKFDEHINEIKTSPLKIKKVIYLNDRLAYRFETWFKGFGSTKVIKKLIASKRFVRLLMKVSSLSGKSGSKHVCIIAAKK